MEVYYSTLHDRFEVQSKFSEASISRDAGFRWDAKAKQWTSTSVADALKLAEYMTAACLKVAEDMSAVQTVKVATAVQASRATDANLTIPAPEGLEYLPFQRAGVDFMSRRQNILLGDEMGLGKTIQILGLINLEKPDSVLIICPAYLKINWHREATKWTSGYKIAVIQAGKPVDTTANFVILNYEMMSKAEVSAFVKSRTWGLLGCDEAHYLKTSTSSRTLQVLGGKNKDKQEIAAISATKRIFATGTPILNRPCELWTIVKAAGLFSDWFQFHKRYCDAYRSEFGWVTTGASNLDELQEKLRSSIMIRRLKADVLKELPAKRHQVLEIEPSTPEQRAVVRAEVAAQKKGDAVTLKLEAARNATDKKFGKNSDEYKAAVKTLKEGKLAAFNEMAKLRHETALAKVSAVVDHIREVLENGNENILVFAHHRDVATKIFEAVGGREAAVLVYGGMAPDARQAAVDRFQSGKVRIFIGTIDGAGTGLTLTNASIVIFAECSWTPSALAQAEDRAHRIGQENQVLVQHIVLEGSFDATMARKIVDKREVIDAALDDVIAMETASNDNVHLENVAC